MKLKIDGLHSEIIKRPEGVQRPLFKKGDDVFYKHWEFGSVKGKIEDVYMLPSSNVIFYDITVPSKRLTDKTEIPEYEIFDNFSELLGYLRRHNS